MMRYVLKWTGKNLEKGGYPENKNKKEMRYVNVPLMTSEVTKASVAAELLARQL